MSRQIESSTLVSLDSLIAYQEGAVVSRQIVKEDTGNITLFAFDQDQGLSEHTAPFAAFVHILDGEAQITISGVSFQLKAGEAILMPENQPHAIKALKPFKMLLTMLRA